MIKITQKLVDFRFANGEIYDYMLDEISLIRKTIKESFSVDISTSEAIKFWEWRSELWDASWLRAHDKSKKEIIDFFKEYIEDFYKENNGEENIELIESVNKNGCFKSDF
jgi:hypothetical protein